MPFAGVDVPKDAVPLVGVELSFTIVAIVSVALRVLTRTWLIKHLGYDDLFIVLSAPHYQRGWGKEADKNRRAEIRYGLGFPPDPDIFTKFMQAQFASQTCYTICHAVVKISISIQYWRIFTTHTAWKIFVSLVVYFVMFGPISIIVTVLTCRPVAKYWDDSLPGNCFNYLAMRYTFAGLNILNDILLLVAPMPFLSSLQMPKRAKFVLMGVFAAGGVACVVAVVRLYTLWEFGNLPLEQRPSRGVQIAIWSGLECNIAIICACIPALRPLLSRLMPGLINSTGSRSGQRSHGQSGIAASHNRERMPEVAPDPNDSRDDDSSEDLRSTKGITVQQSFELNTMIANDDDSERNLVMTKGWARASHGR